MPMQQYVALLRGINVGGHRVKMADLRALFEELGFVNVATFIASGNVIFESAETDVAQLRAQIEPHLRQGLGYEVPTFIRSTAALAAIAAYEPFPRATIHADGHTLSIMFLTEVPAEDVPPKLLAFQTSRDAFHVHGREVYWLCRGKTTESLVDWSLFGKTVKLAPVTVRNATTIRKLAAKYPPP